MSCEAPGLPGRASQTTLARRWNKATNTPTTAGEPPMCPRILSAPSRHDEGAKSQRRRREFRTIRSDAPKTPSARACKRLCSLAFWSSGGMYKPQVPSTSLRTKTTTPFFFFLSTREGRTVRICGQKWQKYHYFVCNDRPILSVHAHAPSTPLMLLSAVYARAAHPHGHGPWMGEGENEGWRWGWTWLRNFFHTLPSPLPSKCRF